MNQYALTVIAAAMLAMPAHADISISKQPTQNMSCSGGVCMPTAKNAVLNVSDLTSMLAGGDLTVQSGNGDGTAAGIEIDDGFSWTNTSRLTLDVKKSIVVKAPITVAGTGNLTLTYAQGNPDGDLLFEKKGKIDFWDLKSSLTINGEKYALIDDMQSLIGGIKANASGYYALAKNFAAGVYTKAPIGTTLTGTVAGLGHAIRGIQITARDAGLFKEIGAGGTVRDVTLKQITIDPVGAHPFAGALAAFNSGTIKGVRAAGEVKNEYGAGGTAGGLVGLNSYGGAIQDSIAAVRIDVGINYWAGGLAGQSEGAIVDSAARGAVQGAGISSVYACLATAYIGGLVGVNSGSIIRSRAVGAVTEGPGDEQDCGERNPYAGGLIGANNGPVDQSWASGSTTASSYSVVGGLIGDVRDGTVTNSYATGDVLQGDEDLGGLAGDDYASIHASYSVGYVYLASGEDGCGTGGLIGCDGAESGQISAAYWDIDTSGASQGCGRPADCDGVEGITDAQLKSGLPDGFDSKIWGQSPSINNGYPYLLANPPTQ